MTQQLVETPFSRRDFLKGTGALVVAISVPLGKAGAASGATNASKAIGPAVVPANQLDSWVAVQGNGRVTVYTGKVELGTGLKTSQLQIAADELDVALESIDLVQQDTWLTVDQGFTAGSQSLKTQWVSGLRHACAEARAALVNMAAKSLGVPASDLTVADGVITSTKDASKSITYAALIGDKKFNLAQTGKVQPKEIGQHRYIGRSIARVDIPDKLTGKFKYVQDVKLPGMLHARVVRPPGLDSKLVSINGFQKGGKPKSLVKVVWKNNYVAVVTGREEDAIQGSQALRVTWKNENTLAPMGDYYNWLRNTTPDNRRVLVNTGDVDKAIAGAKTVVSRTYTYPHQMHGSMGPSAAVADVNNEAKEATVYSSCQGVYQLRGAIATLLGFPARNVHVIYVEGSGCYGLNGADAVALDAAFLSQQVGRPVRVQYSRSDEHLFENNGQAYVVELKAGLDDSGTIVGWDFQSWAAGRGGRPGPPANMFPGVLLGFPETAPSPSPPASPPLGVDTSNATSSYIDVARAEGNVKNGRVVVNSLTSRIFTGPLRSPNRLQYTFTNEIFMDELALAAGADPIAFRLKHLKDQRLIDVLAGVRDLAGWQPRAFPFKRKVGRIAYGRGVAACQYESIDGYVASIAEVEVDTVTGKVKVTKIWNTQDVGIVINPAGVIHQAEGCAVQGVSRALYEEVKHDTKGVTSGNWETYPVFRFTDMPKLEMTIINRPDQPALGAGELLITTIGACIGNAIFDATGARIRTTPFTPARVKAALKAL
jgi:CO/xanthine dehydrogenase Mo-binding subunit